MSELNIAIPSLGVMGLEKNNSLNKQGSVKDPQSMNIVNALQATKGAQQQMSADKPSPLSPEQITETVKDMNSLFTNMNRNLSFTVDSQSGESIIIVKDAENDEMIRQIPSEELLVLRKKMDDVIGILFDTKV
ncbi:MAG: flagellar protein FlaG [Psychromonas sp.]